MPHDPKCYELAVYFLPSTASERLKIGMAEAIQDAVEEYLLTELAAKTERQKERKRGKPN